MPLTDTLKRAVTAYLVGAARWVVGHAFGLGWCDRCWAVNRAPVNRLRHFYVGPSRCWACWRRNARRAA